MKHQFGKHWPELLLWYTAFQKLWRVSILTLQMEEKLVYLANRPEESQMSLAIMSSYKALATSMGSKTAFLIVTIAGHVTIKKQLEHNCIRRCFGCRSYNIFLRPIFPFYLLHKYKTTWNLKIYLLWTDVCVLAMFMLKP